MEVQAARQALVGPFFDVGAVGVEYLHAPVLPVRHVDQPRLVDHDRMRRVELARPRARTAPRLDERPVGGELHQLRRTAAVSHQHEYLAGRVDRQVRRLVQQPVRRLAGLAVRAEGHQHLAVRVHLGDGVPVDVGGPDVAVGVEPHPVGPEVLALPPRPHEAAVGVELHQRVGAAVEDEQRVLRGPDDAGRRAHLLVDGNLQAVRHGVVTEVRRILHLRRIRRVENLGARGGGGSQHGGEDGRERPDGADWRHGGSSESGSCESSAL